MRSVVGSVLTGFVSAAVAYAAPALATTTPLTFVTNGTISNPYAFSTGKSVSSTVGSTTINATITAWNANPVTGSTNYTLTQAQLGQWKGGLGVLSGYDNYNGCDPDFCGTHQIDAIGNTTGSKSYDFVQIVFDKAVTLSAVSRVAYTQYLGSSSYNDDDFSFGNGASAAQIKSNTALASNVLTSASTATPLSSATFNGMLDSAVNTPGECSVSLFGTWQGECKDDNTSTMTGVTADQWHASTVWWISASLLNPDNKPDAFKLYDFTVLYNDAPITIASVPEPASWTMMIGGFGLVGGALRRKKLAERLATA